MRPQTRAALAAALTASLIAVLSACAPSDGERAVKDNPTPSATPSADAEYTVDPLSTYLTRDGSAFDEQRAASEKIIQECMEEQGFQYTPYEGKPTSDEMIFPLPTLLMHTRDWVAQHGYQDVELTFLPPNHVPEVGPNDAYYDALSSTSKEAYDRALWGKSRTQNVDTLSASEKGCNGAGSAAFRDPGSTQPPIIQDAATYLGSLLAHPDVVAVLDDYESCLAEAGYPQNARDEQAIKVQDYAAAHPGVTSEDPEVVKLQASEITMALADWDCADKNDTLHKYLTTLADLEKDYIADHKKELEEAQLWLNQ